MAAHVAWMATFKDGQLTVYARYDDKTMRSYTRDVRTGETTEVISDADNVEVKQVAGVVQPAWWDV